MMKLYAQPDVDADVSSGLPEGAPLPDVPGMPDIALGAPDGALLPASL